MTDLTQLLLSSTLALLLAFLVLVLPLVFMFAGQLRPWFLQMAADRASEASAVIPVSSAPLARRNAPASSTSGSRKVAVSKSAAPARSKKTSSSPSKPKKKVAKKIAKKKTATAKKKTTSKSTASKKPAAKKAATKKVAKKKVAAKAKAKKKAPAGAKIDPELGVIFTKKPAKSDDLKKIAGVAKVLEGKLHAEGVYTYQQIADWTPSQMEAFGERLSFKNRIQRDDWKKQATALHKAARS
jgi:predicted flap endonuclease-1-like 5' DNA nuclease